MMRYRDIIFDFDGTLSDTYPVFTEALLTVMDRHGIHDTYESVYSKLKVSVGTAIGAYDFGIPYREISAEFHEVHDSMAPLCQKPVEHAGELLKFISDSGGRSFIFTHSGSIVGKMMDIWELSRYVTGAVDGSYKIPRKPAPDGVLILIEKYGIDRDSAIIVGDRDIDLESGIAAGIHGCLLDPDHFYDSYTPEYRIDSLKDLIPVIR
ncbi:MAG: HAD hydrolase-like protein [Clostridia bacterium]|nr:HAD hydrolase-like protein [Clostridia bacterium]